MKNFSLQEFQQLCDAERFHSFILSSDNQSYTCPFKYDVTFEKIKIMLNPDIILLSNNSGFIQIKNIECIILKKTESVLGKVFDINYCVPTGFSNFKTLTIIVR